MEKDFEEMRAEVIYQAFQRVFNHQKARKEEYDAGIYHKSSCFEQKPPWETV